MGDRARKLVMLACGKKDYVIDSCRHADSLSDLKEFVKGSATNLVETAAIIQDLETPKNVDHVDNTSDFNKQSDKRSDLEPFGYLYTTALETATTQILETPLDLDAEQIKIVDHVEDIIGDLDSFFAEPSTSKIHDQDSNSNEELLHLFGSDYSDEDPNYIPDSDESETSIHVRHRYGHVLVPESPEILEKLHVDKTLPNSIDGPVGYVTLLLETLLQNVWILVKPTKRRKKAMPSEWEKNINRKRKADGLHYSTKGKIRPAKIPKPIQCGNCKFKCTDNFSEEDRNVLCRNYCKMDFVAKKNFILSLVKVESIKTRQVQRSSNKKPRSFSKKCFFKKDGAEIQVCQNFFSATLCISLDVITDAIAKSDDLGIYTGNDQRGKKEPPNKTKECDVKFVQKHIESFPVIEAHYCRKDTRKKYLAPDIKSVTHMYNLYLNFCKDAQREPVKESKYRSIFCEEYNIGFFHPKKDLCGLCTRYTKADEETKLKMKKDYEEHILRKTTSLAAKDADKTRANSDENFMSITVDLQAVLPIPSGGESIFII